MKQQINGLRATTTVLALVGIISILFVDSSVLYGLITIGAWGCADQCNNKANTLKDNMIYEGSGND